MLELVDFNESFILLLTFSDLAVTQMTRLSFACAAAHISTAASGEQIC